MAFNAAAEERFARILAQSETRESALIPALHLAQEEWRWISPPVMEYVAARLGMPLAKVYGVLTFYTMFHTKPVGRFHLDVCTSISCMLGRSRELLAGLSAKLGVQLEEVTADGMFSINETECLGSCHTAPVVMVNNTEYWEKVTAENVDDFLRSLD